MVDIFHWAQEEKENDMEKGPTAHVRAISRQFISLLTVQAKKSFPTDWLPDSLNRAFPSAGLSPAVFRRIMTQKVTSIGKRLKKHKQTGEIKKFLNPREFRESIWSTIHTWASQLCSC
jgi:hypothetical protein